MICLSSLIDLLKELKKEEKVSEQQIIHRGKSNLYCRVCKNNYKNLAQEFTFNGKSKGTTDILYSARAEGKDVIVCSKCVCSNTLLLNCGGDAIVVFDNDKQKFRVDLKITNSLTDELILEDVKNIKEINGG